MRSARPRHLHLGFRDRNRLDLRPPWHTHWQQEGPTVRFKYVPLVVHVANQGAPFRMSLCKPLFGMAFSLADGELEWHGSALPPGQTYEPPRAHSFRHLRRGRWVGAAGGFAPSRPNGRLLLPLPFRAPGALSSEGGRPRPPGLMGMARAPQCQWAHLSVRRSAMVRARRRSAGSSRSDCSNR